MDPELHPFWRTLVATAEASFRPVPVTRRERAAEWVRLHTPRIHWGPCR